MGEWRCAVITMISGQKRITYKGSQSFSFNASGNISRFTDFLLRYMLLFSVLLPNEIRRRWAGCELFLFYSERVYERF